MHTDESIRRRRTLKEFADEPVDEATLRDLLALAVHAPNHHRTEPWRFLVLGPATIGALAEATGDRKLRRSSTAIVVGQVVDDDPGVADEDLAACAAAIQTLMLGATARGLASYWRTPASLALPAAADLLGYEPGLRVVGLVHLGRPGVPVPPPPPRDADAWTRWLP